MRKSVIITLGAAALLFSSCKQKPTACFSPSSTSVQNAEVIEFTSCADGGDSYLWNFGDGETSTTANAQHAYANPGTYTVTLTVTGKGGSDTKTQTVTVVHGPVLRFKFVFDSALPRLNNLGQPATIPAGHSAQTPTFNLLGAHYIELAPTMYTALGAGKVLYVGEETTEGGSKALIFDKEKLVGNNEEFFATPIKNVTPGSYEWLRVSLAYQNYDITYRINGNTVLTGTLASFIGYNTFIKNYSIKDSVKTINANKAQGFWGFETSYLGYGATAQGQVPSGATTVPNPLFATSPIPSGSCVVTGSFPTAFTVTGNETNDITIVVKVSINNSFEWQDNGNDGYYDVQNGDFVVDMGVRGIYPEVQ